METLEKAILLKKELDSLRPLSKDDEERIMQKFRLDWNYHSNHLEGNSLTYGETKALILFGITAQGKPLKDHFEITGHDEAVKWILEIVSQQRPLNETFIRELHKLILKEPYELDAITPDGKPTKRKIEIGVYKTMPNHVKTVTGEIFRFATPEETPAKMHDLIAWYRDESEKEDTNPIILAAAFHYRFISIHPFDDGNGRTARILMNFILMQFAYPPVIIKTENKQNYFAALRQADAGLIAAFVEYIAQNLNSSLEIMIKGAKGESIEEPDDLEKEIALLKQKATSVNRQTKTSKNETSLLEIIDDSFSELLATFKKKGTLLESFYAENRFFIRINSLEISQFEGKNLQLIREEIKKPNTYIINLTYQYKKFTFDDSEKNSFNSQISYNFKKTKFLIHSGDIGLVYEKKYGEKLEKDEIENLVNYEIRRHKIFIEKKLDELNQK